MADGSLTIGRAVLLVRAGAPIGEACPFDDGIKQLHNRLLQDRHELKVLEEFAISVDNVVDKVPCCVDVGLRCVGGLLAALPLLQCVLALAARCIFFFRVSPAAGARSKKPSDSTAFRDFEENVGQVSQLSAVLTPALQPVIFSFILDPPTIYQ